MSTIPSEYLSLVDDAAVFPPGDAPLARAVPAHHAHRASSYADLVGSFVISDVRLPELLEVVREQPGPQPLPTIVVVTGGAGAVEPAVRWATGTGELALTGLELALRDSDMGELAHNARRMVTVVDQLWASGTLDQEVPVYVEPPRTYGDPAPGWFTALDEIAAADLRLKIRTGGADADAFPTSDELAGCIVAALDRELAFKCTAGLHHALRHTDAATGFEHHGFLNVLLATRASLDGDGAADLAAGLERRDAATVRTAIDEVGPEALVSARRWFTGFGSCSIEDPLEDLTTLALLPHDVTETR